MEEYIKNAKENSVTELWKNSRNKQSWIKLSSKISSALYFMHNISNKILTDQNYMVKLYLKIQK